MTDAKDKLDALQEALDALKERLEQLERFADAVDEALHHVREAQSDCPEEIIFSHHAEMELDENLCSAQTLRVILEQKIESMEVSE